MTTNLPWLEEVTADAATAGFAQDGESFFLEIHGVTDEKEGLQPGDRLAVSGGADAEPGDMVVWWTGKARTLALARVLDDFSLEGVGGFLPPPEGGNPLVRGVVVGRLRRL